MKFSREDQIAALKAHTVPTLRRLGFKGSFPHFFREVGGQTDLIAFQFSSFGGRLTPEISTVGPARNELPEPYRSLPASKLRTHFVGERLRLGAPRNGFPYADALEGETLLTPDEIDREVAALLESQASPWWESARLVV
jgi:hypothetical protein